MIIIDYIDSHYQLAYSVVIHVQGNIRSGKFERQKINYKNPLV